MTPGLHTFSAEQYFASSGVSNSMLKWISSPLTPAHYRAKYIDKLIPDESTPAQEFGTLVHRVLLENDTVTDAFHVKSDGMKFSTKDGIAWRDAHGDRPIITAAESLAIAGMKASLLAHPRARLFIEQSDRERNAYADDNGLLLRARFDMLPTWKGANMIADLKTCERADEMSASSALMKYGYARQAAFYLRIARLLKLGRDSFVFLFVEKEAPYAVSVWNLDPLAIDYADKLIARDLQCLRNCQESGEWPAYASEIQTLTLPPWALKIAEQSA